MGTANERRRYIVTSSLIGCAHTQNDPCVICIKHNVTRTEWFNCKTTESEIKIKSDIKWWITKYIPSRQWVAAYSWHTMWAKTREIRGVSSTPPRGIPRNERVNERMDERNAWAVSLREWAYFVPWNKLARGQNILLCLHDRLRCWTLEARLTGATDMRRAARLISSWRAGAAKYNIQVGNHNSRRKEQLKANGKACCICESQWEGLLHLCSEYIDGCAQKT